MPEKPVKLSEVWQEDSSQGKAYFRKQKERCFKVNSTREQYTEFWLQT